MKLNKWYLLPILALITLILVIIFTVMLVNAEDKPNIYGEPIEFQATTYYYGSLTYTETVPMVGRTVAVDPKVIPLNSTVIVYGEDMVLLGIYQAEDTGRLIKNNIIDIFMEDEKTCLEWGRRKVFIQVVDAKG